MADQEIATDIDGSGDREQYFQVEEIDPKSEEVIIEQDTSDGLTVTLKDSTEADEDTTIEEIPIEVVTEEQVGEVMESGDIISDGNIEISEYQVGDGQEISVVYSNASDVPIIMSGSDVAAVDENEGAVVSQVHVVEGEIQEDGHPQEIVMTEVQSLPQDVQATILNSMESEALQEETAAAEEEDIDPRVEEGYIVSEEPVEERQIVIQMPQVCHPETTSITTITRSEHTLDSLVPPQILATEDEPMATSPEGFSLVTLPHDVIRVTSQGQKASEQSVISESGKTLQVSVVQNDDFVDVETEEASIAKFVPLSGDTMFDSPKSGSKLKPRIVSISGVSGSQMEVVPNFMEGSENEERESITVMKLTGDVVGRLSNSGSKVVRNLGDLSASGSSTFQLSEAGSDKDKEDAMASNFKGEGVETISIPQGQIQVSGSIALTSADIAKLVAEGKLPSDILKFVTTEQGRLGETVITTKGKGKKGKNEMLHGMQLLSECAMRMEEQDGQDEDGTQEGDEEVEEVMDPPQEGDIQQSQAFTVVGVKNEGGEEVPATQLQLSEGTEPLQVVRLHRNINVSEADPSIMHLKPEEYMQPAEELVETEEQTIVEGQEQLVTTSGQFDQTGEHLQVHEVVNIQSEHGPKQVVVPVHVTSDIGQQIGQTQHVIMDSQQISEELIPMVQEEVILEIVEGEEIVVNTSSGNATIVGGMYGTDKATFLPIQNLTSSILQQGLPSSHPLETYSQEVLNQKKTTKGKGKKKGSRLKSDSESPVQAKKRKIEVEPSTSSGGKIQKFQCHVCSKIFDRMKELRDHLLVHYNTKGYVCDFCNKSFTSSSHLRRHVMIHTGERPHKCDYCGEGFIQAVQLRVHKERHGHGPPPPLSRAPPRKGKDGKKLKKKKKKKEKEKEKEKERIEKEREKDKYKCTICNATRKTKKKMKEHMKVHSSARTFQCRSCDEAFLNKNQLTIHEGRHKGKPELACAYCGKPFDTSSHLKRHERIHTGEKPYKCQFCDKAFIQGVQLRLHQRIHTGERPHICSYCGKAFARSQYLKRHACIHTGEKPLKCRFCSERFIQPVQRQQHEKKLHKKKLKKMIAKKKLMQGQQPPIKLVLRLKKKKGKKGMDEDDDSDLEDESASESGSALSSDESS